MEVVAVILVCLAVSLSLVPSTSGQSSHRAQHLDDKCDTECRWTCLLLNTFERVRGGSPNTTSIAATPTCIRGPPGERGPRGRVGLHGPVGHGGIPGPPGEPGRIGEIDYGKIDKMIKSEVRDVLARAWPQTSCNDVRRGLEKVRNRTGGVYDIYPSFAENGMEVYCDLKSSSKPWTVFQRRMDGSVNFNRTWNEYVNGFGSPDKEYWMGLEKLHQLTVGQNLILRVDMYDWDGYTKYAKYRSFSIAAGSDNYRLTIGSYSGNAGDSLKQSSGNQFSTYDQDNDSFMGSSCSPSWDDAGWWFGACAGANLNGRYSKNPDVLRWHGIVWGRWKGPYYSMKFVEMKFQPVS